MTNTIVVESSGHECDTSLSTWLKDILPQTPGLVRKVALRETVLTCREFFERSAAWRVVTVFDVKANKKRYRLSPHDAYSDVTAVHIVAFDGFPIPALTHEPVTLRAGKPHAYWLEGADVVRLHSNPDFALEDGLKVYYSLTPKPTVTKLPRIAVTHFYEAILDGVLGRLFSHPAKPYSNPELGQYHLKRFRNHIGTYAGQAKKGFTASGNSWHFPRFGK